jgi:hypothetical protein
MENFEWFNEMIEEYLAVFNIVKEIVDDEVLLVLTGKMSNQVVNLSYYYLLFSCCP